MARRKHLLPALTLMLAAAIFSTSSTAGAQTGAAQPQEAKVMDNIPEPDREFRAAWVATVANIDWPSKPGLTPDQQRAEAIKILDQAVAINLNGIVFQGRPQADAMYASELEPWSYYLTGEQGKAPEPFYDPLEFWVEEAHKRGLELHVWFNPYRAFHPSMQGQPVSDKSIVKQRPDLVKKLEDSKGSVHYWMDPAEPDVQDWSINVVMDVVRRYDIDGVHFDDYFYPYDSYNNGRDFPDEASWTKYQESGGTLSRGDFRRKAVNDFMERLYGEIKAEKKHVKFGLSPFGIWRPGNPPSIQGLDQYNSLYADAKLWLNKGWVDYYTPQLYWPINRVQQSYPVLLGWWKEQNYENRHLWPGLSISAVSADDPMGKAVYELINQIMITRGMVPEGPGNVLFSFKVLGANRGRVNEALIKGVDGRGGPYAKKALVPPSPWLDDEAPAAPVVKTEMQGNELVISWKEPKAGDSFVYVVYVNQGGHWRHEIVPAGTTTYTVQSGGKTTRTETSNQGLDVREVEEDVKPVTSVAVQAVDRTGNASAKAVVQIPVQ